MYAEWNAGARGHCRVSGALVLYKNITVYAGVVLLAALLSFVCISGDSEAADITVDSLGGNADYTTISAAVSAASNDDVIKVAAREDYVESVDVDKRLIFQGGNEGGVGSSRNLYQTTCDGGDLVVRYKFDQTSGDANDEGCNDLDGDISGASWTTSGFWEDGLEFDGSNDDVEVSDHSSLDITGDLTISAWIYLDDIDHYHIVDKFSSETGYRFKVASSGKLEFAFGWGSSWASCMSDTALDEDTWYLVTAVLEDGDIDIYINDDLDNGCGTWDNDISANSKDLYIGSDGTGNYFEGKMDEVIIWNDALEADDIKALFWAGDGTYEPIIDADDDAYAFNITSNNVKLYKFEVQGSGTSSYNAGIIIYGADEVYLDKIILKDNTKGIIIDSSEDIEMYSSEIAASGIGVLLIDSDNCIFGTADGARGVYVTGSSSTIGLKLENSDGNSFGYSKFNGGDIGILFYGGDSNTVYDSEIKDNDYGVSFTRDAKANLLRKVSFSFNDDFDIHHGYDYNVPQVNGTDNVINQTSFGAGKLSIDADSTLIEISPLTVEFLAPERFSWNRVNKTLDSDRKVFSGKNSFWVGNSELDKYEANTSASFEMSSDISIPSDGTSYLEIKTWYDMEEKYDGGRVYISINDGDSWSLLTPEDGYDSEMYGGSDCYDGGKEAFTGDKSSDGWTTKQFSLLDYKGDDIRIKFDFCSNEDNQDLGWYIDNVKVFKSADILYYDDFERMGHKWIFPNGWVYKGNVTVDPIANVDLKISDASGANGYFNITSSDDLRNYYKLDEEDDNSCCDYDYYVNDEIDKLTPDSTRQRANRQYDTKSVEGKFDNGLKFDGSSDYTNNYDCNRVNGCNRYQDYTVSAWVKFASFPAESCSGESCFEGIVHYRYDGDIMLAVNSTGHPVLGASFYYSNTYKKVEGSTAMSLGVWYNLVGTWSESSDELRIYVNGELDGTTTVHSSDYLRTYHYNYLGRCDSYYTGCNGYMDGLLDNVAIWEKEFTAAEVKTIYDDPLGSLVSYATAYYADSSRWDDPKTDSTGKIEDIYVITKIYEGSTTATTSPVYASFRYGAFERDPEIIEIVDNKYTFSFDNNTVYNRDQETLHSTISMAVGSASTGDVIEIWQHDSGVYKESVDIRTSSLTLIGSGINETIIDAQYGKGCSNPCGNNGGSPIFVRADADHVTIKNLRVTRSHNASNCCGEEWMTSGISAYQVEYLTINNVYFYETYTAINMYQASFLMVSNSTMERGDITSYSDAVRSWHIDENLDKPTVTFENNTITGFSSAIQYYSLYEGLKVYNNHIHNNSGSAIYWDNGCRNRHTNTDCDTNRFEIIGNRIENNHRGIQRGDSNHYYGRGVIVKDNIFKGQYYEDIYANYRSYFWVIENNTFDADRYDTTDDTNYAYYCYYRCYGTVLGNNTFVGEYDSYELYMRYVGAGDNPVNVECDSDTACNSAIRLFNNTFHSSEPDIYVYGSGTGISGSEVRIYNTLNVRTLEEGGDPFSGVQIKINDDSDIYYNSTGVKYGGSDSVTNSNGYLSGPILAKSGYYLNSNTLNDNDMTVNYAYGVRAGKTVITFSSLTIKNVTIDDDYRKGLVYNVDTDDCEAGDGDCTYSTIQSAIDAASSDDTLHIWAWTYNENVEVDERVTLIGNGTANTTINGGTGDHSLEIKSDGVIVKTITLTGSTDSVIFVGSYEQFKADNLTITSSETDYGMHFDGTESSFVANVSINHTKSKSVYISEGDTLSFNNSYFMNTTSSHGFEIDESTKVTLNNVFIYNSGISASTAHGLYTHDSSFVEVKDSTVALSESYQLYASSESNLKVQDSIFIGDDLALFDNSDGFLAENNRFNGDVDGDGSGDGDYGVYIKGTDNAIFKSNTILNSASDSGTDYGAIYLSGSKNNEIKSNTITNSGRSGIHLKSSSDSNEIIGNTVKYSYYSGVFVYSSDEVVIRGNNFTDSVSDNGIKISGSEEVLVDDNDIESNEEYGIYVSSSDEVNISHNRLSENDDGIYLSGSDDAVIWNNTVSDHDSIGIYLTGSSSSRIRDNEIKDNDGDGLILYSNSDEAFVDNNTINDNGQTTSGRALRLYEVDDSTIYKNTIETNEYTGITLTSSSSNLIVENLIDENGKYGIYIENDLSKSANNTIKDNTITNNKNHGVLVEGIFTKLTNNTITDNEVDGVNIHSDGLKTTIEKCIIKDNLENAIHVRARYTTISSNEGDDEDDPVIDGVDTTVAVLVDGASNLVFTNNHVEGGSLGLKITNSPNSQVSNNKIEKNGGHGIHVAGNSTSANIIKNEIIDNEDHAIYIHTSNSANVENNTLKDNDGYAIFTVNSDFVQVKANSSNGETLNSLTDIKDNDGGIKFTNCNYCNVTSVDIIDNSNKGIWLTSGSGNATFQNVSLSDNDGKDLYFEGAKSNKATNITFATISADTGSVFTLYSSLVLVFQNESGSGFEGIHLTLTNDCAANIAPNCSDSKTEYQTDFYGGSDPSTNATGELSKTFILNYKIYNGSTTATDIVTILNYHYGVRAKEKSIDMSTSHTETVSVSSDWRKGLIYNVDTEDCDVGDEDCTYATIQSAVDDASSGDTLHIWAWLYSENVEVDESITIIGNGTGNTTLNATSSGIAFDITSDDVTIKNIKVEGCGNTDTYNAFQLTGEDITLENVIAKTCYRGADIEGSGAWIGNSTFSNNYHNGLHVDGGQVKIYNNTLLFNGHYGIKIIEDDAVIKSNTISNNTESGIHLEGSADVVVEDNTLAGNDHGIQVYNNAPRVLIKDNTISDTNKRGIYVSGTSSNDGVLEANTVTDSGLYGVFIQHSDDFYLGNNSISGSDTTDLFFFKTTLGNAAMNTTFSTISVHVNAYFAIYNDLALKFMQNSTVGFENLDVKLVSEGFNKYTTSYYGGSDSKTDSNGLLTKNFTLKFRIYNGSSTPDAAISKLFYRYGVREQNYDVNMSTSHTETVTVPSYWLNGLVENMDSGLQSSSIQDAIDNASSGDTLKLWAWEYIEYGIIVDKRVTITGNSTSSAIINGNWQDDIISIQSNSVTLKNITIKRSSNGSSDSCIHASQGIGIKIDNVVLDECLEGIIVTAEGVLLSNLTIEDSKNHGIYINAVNTRVENTTIEDSGDAAIYIRKNSTIYNNTIKSGSDYGISLETNDSAYSEISYNTIEDNNADGIFVLNTHHIQIFGNAIDDNEDYGIYLYNSDFIQIKNNEITDNDGGIQFYLADSSNVTGNTIDGNGGKGIWFRNSNDNYIKDTESTDSSDDDLELDDSKRNIGFNFTFENIDVDTNSDFRITSLLKIRFVNGSGEPFGGVEMELFNFDHVSFATPFYSGSDSVSNSTGYMPRELVVAYKVYNGSSTTEDVDTTLKYHFGVRSKAKEIDTGTSHTETITVPSHWTKGLVRNIDKGGGTDYDNIQDAVDAASAEETLHIWAWTYNENIEIDESITIIGNGTANTTINGTWSDSNIIKISNEDVTVKNLKLVSGSNTTALIYIGGKDAVLENLEIYGGYQAIAVHNEAAVISDSQFAEQINSGIQVKAQGLNLQISNSVIRNSHSSGIYVELGAINVNINNNSIHNNTGSGIRFQSYASTIRDNTVVDNDDWGIQINGRTADDEDNIIRNNTILRNDHGLKLYKQDSVVYSNNIKDNEGYGLLVDTSSNIYIWNTTISNNNDYDVSLSAASVYTSGTTFSTINVASNSILTVKSYLDLDVNDASGANMSGIDIKVLENTTQKYATSYFGGSDSKTNSNGTIATFLINSKKYDGSSVSEIIPTYVSARYHDWVETTSFNSGSTIQITVPDLRVNIDGDTSFMYYHIGTAIDNADPGDTIYAWAGSYYENIEIDVRITLVGNGTATVIDTSSGTAINVTRNSVELRNFTVQSAQYGISVLSSESVTIQNIKFMDNNYAIYVEDSAHLSIENNTFDVKDHGLYITGSSSDATVIDNSFRNGTSSTDSCVYQSGDETGDAIFDSNDFDNCYYAWRSSSNGNIFRDNVLNENNYGALLSGPEAYNNLLSSNSFDESNIAIYIYNGAFNNNLFNNTFEDSDDYDIKLSDSEDTVSFNNSFTSIFVSSDANMWVKIYMSLTLYDNSSAAFSDVDLEIMEDDSSVYATEYFDGTDSKTNATGEIETLLLASKKYDGSSTPDLVDINISSRYHDWVKTSTHNINSANDDISIYVDDFRVEIDDVMYYTISGAIASASSGDTIYAWNGTYYESVSITKELTLIGNGTATVINGSFEGDVVTVTGDAVTIEHVTIAASGSEEGDCGLYVSGSDGAFENIKFEYNNIGYNSDGDFNEITESIVSYNAIGVFVENDDNSIIDNIFTYNSIAIQISSSSEDNRIEDNEIKKSFTSGIYLLETEESIIKNNYIHNNTGYGIHLNDAHKQDIRDNKFAKNSFVSIYLSSNSGNSTFINNTFISNDDHPVEVSDSFNNDFIDNMFSNNDEYFLLEGGGSNLIQSNMFYDSGIELVNSNNQLIQDNNISEASEYGIRIYKDSSNNYLSGNYILADDEDIFVGGIGSQDNNRGYNNIFFDIKVQSNGEFIVMDYLGVRTINDEGNMSGNDVKAHYANEILYASPHFGGTDSVTNSMGLIPEFVGPIEIYDGQSTSTEIITTITVRYADWIEEFVLDTSDGTVLIVEVPDLRVENYQTGQRTYHIQTSIDDAGDYDLIIVDSGTYYENLVIHKKGLTLQTTYGNTIIDAQRNGCAVTITRDSVTMSNFTFINASQWENPSNSSGINIESDDNQIFDNQISDSYVGIFLINADSNDINGNVISDVSKGLLVSSSSLNLIFDNTIDTLSSDSQDIELVLNSDNNEMSNNSGVDKLEFSNSDGNKLIDQSVDTIRLIASANNSAIGSSYNYIVCDSSSSLYLKHYLNVYVERNNTPLEDVDVQIWDGPSVIYSTEYFDDFDTSGSKTDSDGSLPEDVLVIYRVFNGSSTGSDNLTKVIVRYGDWFTIQEVLVDEDTILDFDVPLFKIFNQNTGVAYSYIQRAIDNASANDVIVIMSGQFTESMVIDKRISIIGQGYDLTLFEYSSSSSSPKRSSSSSASDVCIQINSNGVHIEGLGISGFSTGILVNDSNNVDLEDIKILDSEKHGIEVISSEGLEILGSVVDGSEDDNIILDPDSSGAEITNTISSSSENIGIVLHSDGNTLDNVTVSGNDDGGLFINNYDLTHDCTDCTEKTEVFNSKFESNSGKGLTIESAENIHIYQNIIDSSMDVEIAISDSSDINIYMNNISDVENNIGGDWDGIWGVESSSSSLIFHDNEMVGVGIYLKESSDDSSIYGNTFSGCCSDSVKINANNISVSDNHIENVDTALLIIGNSNHNLIENNTFFNVDTYEMSYESTESDNVFINNSFTQVSISSNSYFETINFIELNMVTVEGNAEGVELMILQEGLDVVYSTEHYGGLDSPTDSSGDIERQFLLDQKFDGDSSPVSVETLLTIYYDDVEYNISLDMSTSHSRTIWVNLRPEASILLVSGSGDILSTQGEEAVKGADMDLTDIHALAFWPFDEGVGTTVNDTTQAALVGTVGPTPIWNDGNSESETDFAVEFDGTNTKIATDLVLNNIEFSAEMWIKTITSKKQVLFSDQTTSKPDTWGYNLYTEGGIGFDFTVNNGDLVSILSTDLVSDGEWHFVVITRSSDYLEIWVDGNLMAESSWSGVVDFTSSDITIGQSGRLGLPFKGSIDDFRVSDIPRHPADFMTGKGIVEFVSNSFDLDGEITEFIWTSLIDGELGRGSVLYYPVENLTEGQHTIQLEVIDVNGTKSDPVLTILMVMERPEAQITSLKVNGVDEMIPGGGWSIPVNSGDLIFIEGDTSGTQFITEYLWTSDLDGDLSTSNSFTSITLSNGTNIISFQLKAGNGLWSSVQTLKLDVNGRPIFGGYQISNTSIYRLDTITVNVSVSDDNYPGSDLVYSVGYSLIGQGVPTYDDAFFSDVQYNSVTQSLEFQFTPDQFSEMGLFELHVKATDALGAAYDYTILDTAIEIKNNPPVLDLTVLPEEFMASIENDEPVVFTEGEKIELDIGTVDDDGSVAVVTWYADGQEIGTGANFTFEDNNLEPGNHTISVVVQDDEGGLTEQEFEIFVEAQDVEATVMQAVLADFSNNIPLFAALGIGLFMVVGTVLLRRNRGGDSEAVAPGPQVDDAVSSDSAGIERPDFEAEEWELPTDAQGNALVIGEYMAKRRESYLTFPQNEEVLDYLHNNRERFSISSYFEVPIDPSDVLRDWALPENLRGNVHLDTFRQQIVERITSSSPDKNFVIIGEPGVGKTVMLFEVFDRLMYKSPVGILTTDSIAQAHELFKTRVFYDDLPENNALVESLTENDIKGVIVSSREADWKALPTEMQAKFDRLTVPLFSDPDMKAMILKMMNFQSIGYNDEGIDVLIEYSEGSPIYVWSMVREMMHRSIKTLTSEYIKENSIKGMTNYVAQLLQRLLKEGEEYRKGGLHALASLVFLSDHMEERYSNDYFFDAYVETLSKYTEDKLDDKMNPKTLNLVLAYLPINDSVIRFPHDTWPDVLQGWGDMNPFNSELRMINRSLADSGIFQDLKKEVVKDVWDTTYERYKRTPSRQKSSFLALADTLFQNFTLDELKDLGVDIDIVRQVASTYSHIPQAAKLISKIQAVLPQTVTRIINVQDISSEGSHAPYKIQEMYLIYNDGRMITSLMDKEAKVDSDIMSSMLTAINDFVKDSFQTTGNLGSIDYGENQIILERGKETILASVVYGEANRDLRSRMARSLAKIEEEFKSTLKGWNGDIESLSGTTAYLEPIMDISKEVTRDMIDELKALKDISLRSSWTQVSGFVQVTLMINNYSKKELKNAKLTLEYGADFLKLVKSDPQLKYTVTDVDLKKVPANAEMAVKLYFEPLKSTQASLNVHLDYEVKAGQSSGASSSVFERVNLFKEGVELDIANLENIGETGISPEAVAKKAAEIKDTDSKVEEVAEEKPEAPAADSDGDDLMSKLSELDDSDDKSEEKPDAPAADSDGDDLMSKLNELDDPENAPKKKEEKSDEEEDAGGMDDLLGKLDEL